MGNRLNRAVLGLAKARSRKYFEIEKHSKNELPLEGIIYSNHESLVGPVLITTALHDLLYEQGEQFMDYKKIPHYLAKQELQETILKPVYDSLGLIYVNRNNSSKQDFDRYVANTNEYLKNNYIGFFYPGTRSDYLKKGRFNEDKANAENGIFAILNRCENLKEKVYPILPVFISVGAESVNHKSKISDFGRIFGYFTGLKSASKEKPKAIIAFGEPVFEKFPLERKRRREISDYLIETVHSLKREYC